jgi:hypothetical protein
VGIAPWPEGRRVYLMGSHAKSPFNAKDRRSNGRLAKEHQLL